MSALRYYDLPHDPPAESRKGGWIDRVCRSAWAWAIRHQQAAAGRAAPGAPLHETPPGEPGRRRAAAPAAPTRAGN